ncbi:hypothetical protein OBJ96_10870 [Empedobacter falsenii]
MGTWNTKINGNDTFQDIYQNFFDLYNQGQNPADISKQIQDDFAEMFNDYDDKNNSLFGLALAQWETKSLDQKVYRQVKEIIETDNDLDVWKGLGADDKTIEKRKKELDKFLTQISIEREKPKRRVRPKFEFEMINLVNAIAPDNLKKFDVNEEYTNKNYVHTSGLIMWGQGGGSVLYFTGQGKNISAKWLDSKTIEITHDKDIVFTMKKDSAYFCGDDIKVIYKPK